MKKLIENIKLHLLMIAGAIMYCIECLFNKNVMKNRIQKLLNKNYFGLIAVLIAVIGGFIAEWIAWVWLMLYFILWSNFADLKKKKITK